MFDWVRKKDPIKNVNALQVDIHPHLLPGLDDGVHPMRSQRTLFFIFNSSATETHYLTARNERHL